MKQFLVRWRDLTRNGPMMMSLFLGLSTVSAGVFWIIPDEHLGGLLPMARMLCCIVPKSVWTVLYVLVGIWQMTMALWGTPCRALRPAHMATILWVWFVVLDIISGGSWTSIITFTWVAFGDLVVWVSLSLECPRREVDD